MRSYRQKKVRKRVLSLLDTNHDGTLTFDEKQNSRIIIYGHSWGGSEAVVLARKLEKDGIPVLLTIQVDSISKIRQNDAVIPANVPQAANFYQPNGLLHGQPKICAADSRRTRIIGNFRFDYKGSPYKCDEYPWYDRIFGKSHTQIECDRGVWKQAESLMRSNLPVDGNGTLTVDDIPYAYPMHVDSPQEGGCKCGSRDGKESVLGLCRRAVVVLRPAGFAEKRLGLIRPLGDEVAISGGEFGAVRSLSPSVFEQA